MSEESDTKDAREKDAEQTPAEKDEKTKGEKTKDDKPKREKKSKAKDEKAKASSGKSDGKRGKSGHRFVAPLVSAVVALAVGLGIGYFAFGGGTSGGVNGKTTLSESELDSTMATYEYDGKTYKVTARDVITNTSSLDQAKNDDDTYDVPSADGVLSYARSAIVQKAAEDEGIEVSDDDVASYAESQLGTSDYDTIASNYGMDADTAKALIKQSAEMQKLREKVVKTKSMDAPTAPTEPSDGNDQTASADYAKYIIDLAGDEWDADNNTWAATDGPYATALADYTVTNDSATYEAAQAAYYVAYQQYSENQTQISQEWTDYVNGILCKASVNLSTLVA